MSPQGIISKVHPDSLGEEIGLAAGDRLLKVNDQNVSDIIDLSFALADEYLELLIEKSNGDQEIIELEKEYHEDLGVEFESAVFDSVRRCANRCVFCFVDQMPKGMRESLYVKDDDYRLSFLYGNFVTLTNLTPKDMQRIQSFHLTPLYISVHATDPEVRSSLLNNKNASRLPDQLKELIDAGIELHTQIVLCPGLNDGDVLEQTLGDLYKLKPSVLSVAIVPVGLTQYRDDCPELETFNAESAKHVIQQVEAWRSKCREQSGDSFIHLADEFYLMAGIDLPPAAHYDGFPQLENGVGLVRSFLDDWQETLRQKQPAPYATQRVIDVVCGMSAAKVLTPLLDDLSVPNLLLRLQPVANRFFGPKITVSGLLTGSDILDSLPPCENRDGIIIPGVSLRKGESVFLDGMTLEELSSKLNSKVYPAYSAQELHTLLTAWR
ncbi:DUF512 domain-containing protein [Azotosporobacter soli]|uniref:DUF512 domain-containing protein n=1 Tax=Azotosporobacter soli TaxID=3055040 RepID=UPI0031FED377